MSEEEEGSIEEIPDGLECFSFQLLLDDVSSSNKKMRQQKENSSRHLMGNQPPSFKGAEENISLSLRSDLEVDCMYNYSEDTINSIVDGISANQTCAPQSSQQETRSECPERRKSFNIWGEHFIDNRQQNLISKIARNGPGKKTSCPGSETKYLKNSMEKEVLSPEPIRKKKSLRLSKRDEFYPKEVASNIYRKLSYQDHEPTSYSGSFFGPPVDFETFGAPFHMILSKHIQDDVHTLISIMHTNISQQIQSREDSEFPTLQSML